MDTGFITRILIYHSLT